MRAIEADLRKLSTELLDRIVPQRECDFVESYAKRLPIVTFLRLVDLPLSDREHLLRLTDMSVRPRDAADTRKAYEGLHEYTQKWIRERREHPGSDLFSKIVNARIDDQPLTEVHTAGLLSTVLFGGLDTVASALSFTARCLAEDPAARARLRANRDLIPKAVEEFLRRFGIPNTSRVMARDFEYQGLSFRAGEQILLPKALHGLDERRYPRPLQLDFDRPRNVHAAFGAGPHHCPGSLLARMELRIFLEQWLERIPDFHLQPGRPPRTSSGRVNAMLYLPLAW
jgi:cytochrome P450